MRHAETVLILAATPLEAARLSASQVVITGIGAVNTAHALTQYLLTRPRPSLVIQTGIAGAYVPGGLAVEAVALATSETYGDVGVLTPQGWRAADEIGIPLVEAHGSRPARFNEFPLDPELVARAVRKREPSKHPATRTFQALRMHVNDELGQLRRALDAALGLLAVGGRLAVISFHSLEDRMVKQFIQRHSSVDPVYAGLPVIPENFQPRLKRVGGKVRAGEAELGDNPRARSSVLRVAQKVRA